MRTLQNIGSQINATDQEILKLVARRMRLASEVVAVKADNEEPIFRGTIEDQRIDQMVALGQQLGLNSHFVQQLAYAMINESCKIQMQRLQNGSAKVQAWLTMRGTCIALWPRADLIAYHIQVKNLCAQEVGELTTILHPVASSAFGCNDPSFKDDVAQHIAAADHIACVVANGGVVAFRMWNNLDSSQGRIIYLSGMCIAKEVQRLGIGSQLLRYTLTETGDDWDYAVLRTQNPIMHKCFMQVASSPEQVFAYGDTSIPRDVAQVAQHVAGYLNDDCLQANKLYSPGVYGHSLYGEHVVEVAQQVPSGLDQAAGDAMYCVWRK